MAFPVASAEVRPYEVAVAAWEVAAVYLLGCVCQVVSTW